MIICILNYHRKLQVDLVFCCFVCGSCFGYEFGTRTERPEFFSLIVTEFLVKHETKVTAQPSYSPNLVACDFFLFPKLKYPLRGTRHKSIQPIQRNSLKELKAIPAEADKCMVNSISRYWEFFLESNRLTAKISKNKKFLKFVKEYIQIFSGWFEQFFYFAKIMLFAKLKSCSKRYEKIQTYSLSDSKNFSFLVIFSVCSYFLSKKILNLFVKIL